MSSESQSIIVFMNILDPSGRLTDPNPKRALRTRRLLRHEILGDKELAQLYEKNYRHIDSTVVLAIPVGSRGNYPEPIGLPFHAILSLVHGLAELSLHYIYLGGVMTLGVAHAGPDALHGPALAAAQHMHEVLPPYPRIVIDPHLLRSIERDPLLRAHHADQEMQHVKELLSRDRDGLWCIDYLHAIEHEISNEQEYIEFLQEHKRSVETSAAKIQAVDGTALAMNWLAEYHDREVERIGQAGQLSQDELAALRIDADMPLRFAF